MDPLAIQLLDSMSAILQNKESISSDDSNARQYSSNDEGSVDDNFEEICIFAESSKTRKQYKLSMDLHATVLDIKHEIQKKTELSPQKLIHKGRILKNKQTIFQIGLKSNDVIVVIDRKARPVEQKAEICDSPSDSLPNPFCASLMLYGFIRSSPTLSELDIPKEVAVVCCYFLGIKEFFSHQHRSIRTISNFTNQYKKVYGSVSIDVSGATNKYFWNFLIKSCGIIYVGIEDEAKCTGQTCAPLSYSYNCKGFINSKTVRNQRFDTDGFGDGSHVCMELDCSHDGGASLSFGRSRKSMSKAFIKIGKKQSAMKGQEQKCRMAILFRGDDGKTSTIELLQYMELS